MTTFGENVYELARRRGLQQQFPYADVQALKAVASADELRAFLAARGLDAGPERIDPLHFVDLMEIAVLRKRLEGAKAAVFLS